MATPLLSVAVGAVLGFVGSALLGWRQRGWQERRARFDRELLVAERLDTILVETQLHIIGKDVPEGEDRWQVAHQKWQEGWVRLSPFLTSSSLEERFAAVGTALFHATMDRGESSKGQLHRFTQRAIENARLALAYFVRGYPLPPASFPSGPQLLGLLDEGEPHPLFPDAPIWRWLDEHPAADWHPGPGPKQPWWKPWS